MLKIIKQLIYYWTTKMRLKDGYNDYLAMYRTLVGLNKGKNDLSMHRVYSFRYSDDKQGRYLKKDVSTSPLVFISYGHSRDNMTRCMAYCERELLKLERWKKLYI